MRKLLLPFPIILAIVGCHTAASHSKDRSVTETMNAASILASARADIDAANAAWLPGLRNRDAQSIAAAYADDGLFIAPDGTVTRGRAAIIEMYNSRFPHLREILSGDVVQDGVVAAAPDVIYEWGHAWLEMAPAESGQRPVRTGGAYLTIWQRSSDGHWRITRSVAL